MNILEKRSRSSINGSPDYFSGMVQIERLVEVPSPGRTVVAEVTFEPGARTAWHTHPLGQTIVVSSGCGWAQRWGGPVETINPGDTVFFPAGEKHWHGATSTSAMSHIAIQEKLEEISVEWLEHVTDEEYLELEKATKR